MACSRLERPLNILRRCLQTDSTHDSADLEFARVHPIIALDERVSKVVQRVLHELLERSIVEILIQRVPQVVLRPVLDLPLERRQDDLHGLFALLLS